MLRIAMVVLFSDVSCFAWPQLNLMNLDEQAPAASSDLTILSDQNKKQKLLVSPCISSFYCIQSL